MRKFTFIKSLMLVCMLMVSMGAWATTVTKTISDVVSAKSYSVSVGSTINTKCTSIDLDANINVSITVKDGASGNTGTFWGTDPNIDWRLYQSDEPTITVSAEDGFTISSVKFTYSNSNTGVINTSGHGQSIAAQYRITSGNAYVVNAASATYYVGNTSTKSNGQARITAIEVVYTSNSGGGSTPEPTKYNVTVAGGIANGTVSANASTAAEGATVTLTATPASGYYFDSWNVTNASTSAAITVTNNKFTMPAANVNVSASFLPFPAFSGSYVDFDLSTDQTATATEDEMTWTNAFVNIAANKGSASTNTNNYYPGTQSYKSTRFYKNSTLAFTPATGVTITGIEFTTTSSDYATAFGNSSWTNGDAVADAANKTTYVTPTNGNSVVSATIGATTGGTKLRVYYTATFDVITLNAACTDGVFVYGTYSNTSAWVVPADLFVAEAYVLGDMVDVETYMYDEGDVVPANTGVLICALADGNYKVELSNEAGESVLGDENALRATGAGITAEQMATNDPDKEYFRLTMHNGTDCGFWWGAENGAAFDLGANKAYLVADPAAGGAKGFTLGQDAETVISAIKAQSKAVRYNLAGQRVDAAYKGIVIVNGKKVVK